MNRNDEYQAMIRELDQPAPELDTTLERAYSKRRKKNRALAASCTSGLATCFMIFVLLVNFCTPVAYACSQIPILRELAEAVTISRSLTDAVENEYVQMIDLSQTENDITASVEYLIVDQKQVNVFYRLDSDMHDKLEADADSFYADGSNTPTFNSSSSFGVENGGLRNFTIDFGEGTVPDSLKILLEVYANEVNEVAEEEGGLDSGSNERFPDDVYEKPEYLADFEFLLKFDPEFTATGKIYDLDRTVELEGQAITITDIEVYPTHIRVDIEEAEENTAWLKDLEFYIETDWGMKFDPVSNGITATGTDESPSMVSYRADSTYFYEAENLRLVITGARWLRKDRETVYLDLATGEHGEIPEGTEFDSAVRQGDDWIVSFKVEHEKDGPIYQVFGHKYYDAAGNEYEITQWGSTFGESDEDGKITYFYDEFPLKDYPYDEVWLSPQFSHDWVAEDLIVISVQ